MPKTLLFDIETNGLLNELTHAHCLVTKDLDTGEVRRFRRNAQEDTIDAGLAYCDTAEILVAHNGLCFDLPALLKLKGWKPKARPLDTIVCTRLIWSELFNDDCTKYSKRVPKKLWGSHSLEAWGYRLGIQKSEHVDWSVWSQQMEDYCVQDVQVTEQLLKRILAKNYSPIALEIEHEFRALMFLQERRGFRFNVEAAKKFYSTLSKKRHELELELQSIFPSRKIQMKTPAYYSFGGKDRFETKGEASREFSRLFRRGPKADEIKAGPLRIKEVPFNPGSTAQIAQRLIETHGWKPKAFTPGGDPQVTETILEALKFPECPKLVEFLTVNKRLGQLAEGKQAWLKLEKFGRIYGTINTNGAVTGRCTHSNPNIAQVPTVYSPWGKECRSLFGPSSGWLLVGWDASGLELRCLAHYMAKWDGGQYGKILLEADIHKANQEAAGLPTRDQAKTFIYAFLYGAGDEKIGSIVERGPKEGRRLREQFLRKFPALRKLKEALDYAVQTRGFLFGLDGRKLLIRSSHAALNTLLQSAGAVAMKKAALIQNVELLKVGLKWGEDYAHVANVHDELQIEAKTPQLAQLVGETGKAAIKEAGNFFKFRCPLDGEFKVGNNWADTH
jgi:DNA polymerase I